MENNNNLYVNFIKIENPLVSAGATTKASAAANVRDHSPAENEHGLSELRTTKSRRNTDARTKPKRSYVHPDSHSLRGQKIEIK